MKAKVNMRIFGPAIRTSTDQQTLLHDRFSLLFLIYELRKEEKKMKLLKQKRKNRKFLFYRMTQILVLKKLGPILGQVQSLK